MSTTLAHRGCLDLIRVFPPLCVVSAAFKGSVILMYVVSCR